MGLLTGFCIVLGGERFSCPLWLRLRWDVDPEYLL